MSDRLSTTGTLDAVLPFQVEGMGVRGRLVRLSRVAAPVLADGRYPAPVAALVLETLSVTALLASVLKYDGIFTLQVQGDGPINLVVADTTSDGDMRAYARFDADALARTLSETDGLLPHLVGAGHMAFTVDQGPDTERYQGITELSGTTLSQCAAAYFRLSEQLDTAIVSARGTGAVTAAAMMVQRLPSSETDADEAGEAWREAAVIAGTLTPDELLRAELAPADLLFRLYHERGVRIFGPQALRYACRCSRERVSRTLAAFPRGEIEDLLDDGTVTVTCEYCGNSYGFAESDLDALLSRPINRRD